MGKVIAFPELEKNSQAVREHQDRKGPWIIYVGRLSEGERIECSEDGAVMIYTESLERVPSLIEKGKKLRARKSVW